MALEATQKRFTKRLPNLNTLKNSNLSTKIFFHISFSGFLKFPSLPLCIYTFQFQSVERTHKSPSVYHVSTNLPAWQRCHQLHTRHVKNIINFIHQHFYSIPAKLKLYFMNNYFGDLELLFCHVILYILLFYFIISSSLRNLDCLWTKWTLNSVNTELEINRSSTLMLCGSRVWMILPEAVRLKKVLAISIGIITKYLSPNIATSTRLH